MSEDTASNIKTEDDAKDQAAFGSGFSGADTKADKPNANEKPAPVEAPRDEQSEAAPEVVQISRKDWEEVQAAARRTASYEHQFSRLHGTTGKLKELVNELRSQTPRDLKVDLPAEAFTKMAKDFPELAELSREEFQTALAGLRAAGNAKPDAEAVRKVQMDLEAEDLDDLFPDWKQIVGAVPEGSEPDPENPFRKWLATKDKAYQDRINGTIRAPIIQRAIGRFQTETKAPPSPSKPRGEAQADRIKAAMQPRGDNAGTPPGNSEEEAFAEGYRSR